MLLVPRHEPKAVHTSFDRKENKMKKRSANDDYFFLKGNQRDCLTEGGFLPNILDIWKMSFGKGGQKKDGL